MADWRQDSFPDRLEHSLSGLCREVHKHRRHFQRLLPFVIANTLANAQWGEMRFPLYLLMNALDEHDKSLLSANLPQLEKRKFGQLHAQFYESNKIIG
jgi:hypothetical protein